MELSAFFQSGIVVNSPEFDALASEAARTHNMPFFEDLQGESEAILEDVKMTAKKIGSNKDVSTTIYRQNMWGASNLSAALAGADLNSCRSVRHHYCGGRGNTGGGNQNGRSYS